MNRIALSTVAVFALSPIALLAQNQPAQNMPTRTPAAAPVLYAEAEAPALFSSSLASSSLSSDELAAPAAYRAASAASAAVAHTSSGVKPFSALGVGVKIGTAGIGFDAAVPLLSRLNIRGGAGFYNYTYNGTIDNDPISATLKLNNAEVMVDLFPFNGSFRLSAGTTVYNTTGLTGTGAVAGGSKITVGNSTYISNPANPVTVGVVAGFGGKTVPRFTLGWGNMVARNHRIRFETEFGVDVIGTPTAVWTYSGSACMSNSNGSACTSAYAPIASADISVQNADLENDLTNLKVFPILSLGLSVKLGHK